MGNPPWTEEARFATFKERKANEEALNVLVETWTIQHEAERVMTVMQESGVPAGILNNGEDLHRDPQLAHDGYYVGLEHPVMGEVGYPRHSIEFSKAIQEVHRSPCLGEHTQFVCKQIIGLSDAEFRDHAEKGVFQ